MKSLVLPWNWEDQPVEKGELERCWNNILFAQDMSVCFSVFLTNLKNFFIFITSFYFILLYFILFFLLSIFSSFYSESCGWKALGISRHSMDERLLVHPGIKAVPLRWESQVQDTGPQETSQLHVIPNGENLPEISISMPRPSFTQRPAS